MKIAGARGLSQPRTLRERSRLRFFFFFSCLPTRFRYFFSSSSRKDKGLRTERACAPTRLFARARSPLCQHDAPIHTSARSRYVGRPPATWPAGEPPDTLPFRGRPKFPEGVRLHPSTTKQSRTKLITKGGVPVSEGRKGGILVVGHRIQPVGFLACLPCKAG